MRRLLFGLKVFFFFMIFILVSLQTISQDLSIINKTIYSTKGFVTGEFNYADTKTLDIEFNGTTYTFVKGGSISSGLTCYDTGVWKLYLEGLSNNLAGYSIVATATNNSDVQTVRNGSLIVKLEDLRFTQSVITPISSFGSTDGAIDIAIAGGKFGYLSFSGDGGSDYVDLGSHILTESESGVNKIEYKDFSVEGWFKSDDYTKEQSIFGQNNDLELGIKYDNTLKKGLIKVWRDGITEVSFDVTGNYNKNRWNHIALVSKSDGISPHTLTLYWNGKRINQTTGNANNNENPVQNATVGSGVWDNDITEEPLYGAVFRPRYWGKALTDADVRKYMTAIVTEDESGLLASYEFDEAGGNKVYGIGAKAAIGTVVLNNDTNADVSSMWNVADNAYSYEWTKDGDVGFSSYEEDLSNIGAGTYHVKVTNMYGISINKTFVITEANNLEIQGRVYQDNDNDNIFDTGEGVNGLEIKIFEDGNPTEVATLTSNSEGLYKVNGLSGKEYTIRLTGSKQYYYLIDPVSGEISVDYTSTYNNVDRNFKLGYDDVSPSVPTVDYKKTENQKPVITGTYDNTDTHTLTVQVNGVTYTLGTDPELTVSGNNWSLDLSGLAAGLDYQDYDVVVITVDVAGNSSQDANSKDLTIENLAFACQSGFFQTVYDNSEGSGNKQYLKIYSPKNQDYSLFSDGSGGYVSGSVKVNAAGFNKNDGYVYALAKDYKLAKIDNKGVFTYSNNIIKRKGTGISFNKWCNTGDIVYEDDGTAHLYIKESGGSVLYKVTLDMDNPVYETINITTSSSSETSFSCADMAYSADDKLIYILKNNSKSLFTITRDGEISKFSNIDGLVTGGYGAQWITKDKYYYVFNNDNGRIYKVNMDVDPSTPGNQSKMIGWYQAVSNSSNDGAGCPDQYAPVDSDKDEILDFVDLDADGDGIPNSVENGGNDPFDGIQTASDYVDTDGDFIPNFLDLDSDNDGIPDNIEGQATTGYKPPLFKGTPGQPDYIEDINEFGINKSYGNGIIPSNVDGALEAVDAQVPDFLDTDSDNDGTPDSNEGIASYYEHTGYDPDEDYDKDGILNKFDSTVDVYGTSNQGMTSKNDLMGKYVSSSSEDELYFRLGDTFKKEPPVANPVKISVAEDVVRTTLKSDFKYSDPDGDVFKKVRIISVTDGKLFLDGKAGSKNGTFDSGELISGGDDIMNLDSICFVSDADENGTDYSTITYKVFDGEVWSVAKYKLTIDVTPVNDAPKVVVTKGTKPVLNIQTDDELRISVQEGEAISTVLASAVVTDADGEVLSAVLSGTDSDDFTFTLNELKFKNVPDYENPIDGDTNNDYVVTLTATDGSGAKHIFTIYINVVNVTEIPILTAGPVCSGTRLASASVADSFKWFKVGTPDTEVATTDDFTPTEAGEYYVKYYIDGNESEKSNNVVVNQTPAKPVFTDEAAVQGFCVGASGVTLTNKTDYTSIAGETYVWKKGVTSGSLTEISGATNSTYLAAESGFYSLEVKNGSCVSEASSIINVVESPLPAKPTISGKDALPSGNIQISGGIAKVSASATTVKLASSDSEKAYRWSDTKTTKENTINIVNGAKHSVTVINNNDCENTSDEITITVNKRPVLKNTESIDLPEDTGKDFVVVDVNDINSTIDKDQEGDNLTYSFVDASSEFNIHPTTGVITVKADSQFDYDGSTKSYTLKVKANDGFDDSNVFTVTVNLTNINEAPTSANFIKSVNEDVATQFTVSEIVFNDEDITDTEFKKIKIFPPSKGDIVYHNGNLIIVPPTGWEIPRAELSDYNFRTDQNESGNNYATIKFQVSDDEDLFSGDYIITINAAPVNDKPEVTVPVTTVDSRIEIVENIEKAISGISVSDTDGDNQTVTITVTGGKVKIDGTELTGTITGTIAEVNTKLATMIFVPNTDFVGDANIEIVTNDTNIDSDSKTIYLKIFRNTDGDSVADIYDIDSDNDGIIDVIECKGSTIVINGDFENAEAFGQIDESRVPGWETTATDDKIEVWNKNTGGHNYSAYSGEKYVEINATQNARIFQVVSGVSTGAVIKWKVSHHGRAKTDRMHIKIGTPGNPQTRATVETDETAWIVYSGVYVVKSSDLQGDKLEIGFESDNATQPSYGNLIDDIQIIIANTATCDNDGDGYANFIDLDSDNDGIPDNIEAQTTTGYKLPQNSFSPNGVDLAYGNGGVTPVDTDKDGIPDFLDTDSDDDSVEDKDETGITLTGSDVDKDGLGFDSDDSTWGPVNSGMKSPLKDSYLYSDLTNEFDFRVLSTFPVITVVNTSVNENVTEVVELTATDSDTPVQTLTWNVTLGGADSDKFKVTERGGKKYLSFKAAPDAEAKASAESSNVYKVEISVTDNGQPNRTTKKIIDVTVDDVNDVIPEISAVSEHSMFEDVSNNTDIVTVLNTKVSDGDITSTTYQNWTIVSGDDNGVFDIDPTSGVIEVSDNSTVNFEVTNKYTLKVTVSDGVNMSAQQTVIVNVKNINEAPTSADFTKTVDEDVETPFTVSEFAFNDVDVTDTEYRYVKIFAPSKGVIINGSGSEVTIPASGLNILRTDVTNYKYKTDKDGFGNPYATIRFQVSDDEDLFSGDYTITIKATGVNDKPVFDALSPAITNVDENVTDIVTVNANDVESSTLTYSISTNHNDLFSIDSDGKITVAPGKTLDKEIEKTNNITLVVRATDGASEFTDMNVEISVNNVNDVKPVITAVAEQTVAENKADGETVVDLNATDSDFENNTTFQNWTIVSGNNGAFEISPSAGIIKIKDVTKLDYESLPVGNKKFTLGVTVQDTDGTSLTSEIREVVINITDVDETPVVSPGSYVVADAVEDILKEISKAGILTKVTDPEGVTLSIKSIKDIKNATVAVNAGSNVDFTSNENLNDNNVNSDKFRFIAVVTDGTFDVEVPVEVKVASVNDAPEFTISTSKIEVDEDFTTTEFVNVTPAAVPADELTQIVKYSITSGVVSFADVSIDENSGKVSITKVDNKYGTATITIQADDQQSKNHLFTQSFNLIVKSVNDKPVFDALSPAITNVDENVTDIVTVNANDVESSTLTYSISTNHNDLFSIDSDGKITVAPGKTLDKEIEKTNNITLVVRATDGASEFTVMNVEISVNNVNDIKPVITAVAEQTVAENKADGETVVDLNATDSDFENNTSFQNWTIVSGNNGAFEISPSTGIIKIKDVTKLDYESLPLGNKKFTLGVTVQDTDGTSLTSEVREVVINITDVDETPVVSPGSYVVADAVEDILKEISKVGILAKVTDPEGVALSIKSVKDIKNATVAVNAGGNVDFTSNENLNDNNVNSDKFRFIAVVTDGTFDVEVPVELKVASVNDAPKFEVSDIEVDEDCGPKSYTNWTSFDAVELGQIFEPSHQNTGNDKNELFLIQPEVDVNGNLTFTPAKDKYGTATVTVTAKDNGGTANGGKDLTIKSFTLTIKPVNDAPVITITNKSLTYTENATALSIWPEITITDIDDTDPYEFTLEIVDWKSGEKIKINDTEIILTNGKYVEKLTSGAGGILFSMLETMMKTTAYYYDSENPEKSETFIKLTVRDIKRKSSNTVTQRIVINPVNDAPVISVVNAEVTCTEGAAPVNVTTGLTITDADDTIIKDYTINVTGLKSTEDVFKFGGVKIEDYTMKPLSVTEMQNLLASITYENTSENPDLTDRVMTIKVNDGDDDSNTITVTIKVKDLNDKPTLAGKEVTLDETVTNITNVIGADIDGTVTKYRIGNDASGLFQIDNSGNITVKSGKSMDYETATDKKYVITVIATDDDNADSDPATITINVTDINDNAPVVTASQAFSIEENSINTAFVGTVTATDADTNFPMDWTLVSVNGSSTNMAFTIKPATGEIKVADNSQLDFETTKKFTLRVKVSDGINESSEEDVIVNITNQNEAPVIIVNNTTISKSENVKTTDILATATSTDVDEAHTAQNLTYSLEGDDAAHFTIVGGELKFSINPDFDNPVDNDGNNIYKINIIVADNGGLKDSKSVSVTITNADGNTDGSGDTDNPVTKPVDSDNPAINVISENAKNDVYTGLTAKATDADGDKVTYRFKAGEDADGRFLIDATSGKVYVADETKIDADVNLAHDIVVIAHSTDGSEKETTFTITVKQADGSSDGDGDTDNLITGLDIEDKDSRENKISENATVGTEVKITANVVDKDNDVVTYKLDGDFHGWFEINETTGVITVKDNIDYEDSNLIVYGGPEKYAVVTVRATSTDGSTTIKVFQIEITKADGTTSGDGDKDNLITGLDIEDTDKDDNEVDENSPVGTVVQLTAFVKDADGDDIIYSFDTGVTNNDLFDIDPKTGVVTTKQPFDFETKDTYTVVVRATSTDGSTTIKTFTIKIKDVNEAPEVTTTTPSTIDENTSGVEVAEVTGADVDAGDTQTYTVDDPRFEIIKKGGKNILKLKDDQEIDYETEDKVTVKVTVTDKDGLTDTIDVVITIINNDTPVDPNDDTDGDGIPNKDDNCPTTPNTDQKDIDGDGIGDVCDDDKDGDGIPNDKETSGDTDGDGIPDDEDGDSDGDGTPDSEEKGKDTDGDGIPDDKDDDDDNDGIKSGDEKDKDTDGDGIPDSLDKDDDNDGIPTEDEGDNTVDTDGDGTPDNKDDDSDGDGVSDEDEGPATKDSDGDGIPDFQDDDDDNDGVKTSEEKDKDTDGDGIPDNLDKDDDGDGIPTEKEGDNTVDTDGDGTPDNKDTDSDGDGITDQHEGIIDTDGDGTSNFQDTDSDNDGIPDETEGKNDTDGDGLENYVDLDSDDDGILDETEWTDIDGSKTDDTDGKVIDRDRDDDGTPNYLDTDSDGDGILDEIEGEDDTDGDGIANYLDLDSDGDKITDEEEKNEDKDNDGTPDYIQAKSHDIHIYNTFTPDQDGVNDHFHIKGSEYYPDNTVKIFSRWGNKIREFKGYNNADVSWDGTNENGDHVPSAVYYYVVEINGKTYNGWVMVASE